MSELLSPIDRVKKRLTETASIADDAQRTALTTATVLGATGQPTPVRVDLNQRICLPVLRKA